MLKMLYILKHFFLNPLTFYCDALYSYVFSSDDDMHKIPLGKQQESEEQQKNSEKNPTAVHIFSFLSFPFPCCMYV